MLTDLLLIKPQKVGRDTFYKILKNNHIVVKDEVEVLQAEPILLRFDYMEYHAGINQTFQVDSSEVPEGTNALLVGKGIGEHYCEYFPASPCRLKRLDIEPEEDIIRRIRHSVID